MRCSAEGTRRTLQRALDRDLELYERYVLDKGILVEYLEETKRALMLANSRTYSKALSNWAMRRFLESRTS